MTVTGRGALALVIAMLLLSSCRTGVALPAVATAARAVTSVVRGSGATTMPANVAAPLPGNGGIPAFSHIFEIVLENASYDQVYQNNVMPYLSALGAANTMATKYDAITHPSLPNYLALLGGSTFGVHTDCLTCSVSAPNLVDQLELQGKTWRAYMEGMPAACSPLPIWPFGHYAKKHNPFLYFADIRGNANRCHNIVPFSGFVGTLAGNAVPNFVWITPNLCHDGHDCSLMQVDQWLASVVPTILHSLAYRQGGLLVITFDEAADGSTGGCCTLAAGGQVYTLVASPLARHGAQVNIPYDHYSVLRTIEDAWKLPHLAGAGDPATVNLAAAFATPTP